MVEKEGRHLVFVGTVVALPLRFFLWAFVDVVGIPKRGGEVSHVGISTLEFDGIRKVMYNRYRGTKEVRASSKHRSDPASRALALHMYATASQSQATVPQASYIWDL